MQALQRLGAVLGLVMLIGTPTRAADEDAVLRRAAELLEEIAASPDSGIPAQLLREAQGVKIVPHIVETQFGVGRKHGDGIYLARGEDGQWGPLQLVRMTNLTVGAEAGHQVTDLVVIYRTRKAAEGDANKLALGANLTYLNRQSFRKTDPRRFRTWKTVGFHMPGDEIQTYSRSRGYLLGVRLDGEFQSRAEPQPSVPEAPTPGPSTGPATSRSQPATHPDMPTPPVGPTPEATRIKAVLATLMPPPTPAVAARATVDPHVQATAGLAEPTAIAPAAAQPR